jgi:hypothetical protein
VGECEREEKMVGCVMCVQIFFVYFRRAVFALRMLVMRELCGVDIVPIGDVFNRD